MLMEIVYFTGNCVHVNRIAFLLMKIMYVTINHVYQFKLFLWKRKKW